MVIALMLAAAMKRIAAYLCLAVGAVGLALPLLPGIPLLIIGLTLLGRRTRFGERWLAGYRGPESAHDRPVISVCGL